MPRAAERWTALAIHGAELESRVRERTAELATANDHLRGEIERRNQSERNFRGLIDAAPDAILVIDTDGRVVRMNDEAERLFGYNRDGLLGRDVETIIPERFRAAHHAKRETYGQTPTTRTIAGELAAKRADGTEFPVEIRVSLLDAQGQRSIVGIVRDVTERHRAQQIQQRLVHNLGERVKELTALHATGRLLNEPKSHPDDVLAGIVELLPAAWQYPEITAARITTGDIDVRTNLFELTPWVQRADFTTSAGRTGVIEIVYREARPNADEGPFLTEERSLLQSLAGMLGAYFERVQAEEDRLNLTRAEVGASAGRAREFGQGRIPGHPLSRTALTAERDAWLDPDVAIRPSQRRARVSRIRDSGSQCATAGTINRRPSRRLQDHRRQIESRKTEDRSRCDCRCGC